MPTGIRHSTGRQFIVQKSFNELSNYEKYLALATHPHVSRFAEGLLNKVKNVQRHAGCDVEISWIMRRDISENGRIRRTSRRTVAKLYFACEENVSIGDIFYEIAKHLPQLIRCRVVASARKKADIIAEARERAYGLLNKQKSELELA